MMGDTPFIYLVVCMLAFMLAQGIWSRTSRPYIPIAHHNLDSRALGQQPQHNR